jgi:hypothetical protein
MDRNQRQRLKYNTNKDYQQKEKDRSKENWYNKMGYTYEQRQEQLLIPRLYIDTQNFIIKFKHNNQWINKKFRHIKQGQEKTLLKVLEYIQENFNGKYIDKTN